MKSYLEPLLRELMGAELRAERHRQRRTLAEVATAAGVSMQHLSDVERGRKDPSSELLAAILGALGVDLPLLLLRAADGAVARTPSGQRGAPVLELRSSPAGAAADAPDTHVGATPHVASRAMAGAAAARPSGEPGVTLLAAA